MCTVPCTILQVLDRGLSTYESDVYSFAMVIVEVLTRDVPWSTVVSVQEIFRRVVVKGQRPVIPHDALVDLADMARSCWATEPAKRPRMTCVMKSITSRGWKEA